jgi:hypothetical protein
LICALALTGTSVFFFFYLLLYAPTSRWPLLIGGVLAGLTAPYRSGLGSVLTLMKSTQSQ